MRPVVHAIGLFPLPLVLVADPDPDTRELYSLMLSDVAQEILPADDGRIALARALAQRPQLVVTDTQLPFIDGYAFCHLLRRDPATANVPVIIVTSDATAGGVHRGHVAGANAVLVKP